MRKLLFLLFAAFAAFAILNCSADDDMPCMSCKHDPYPSQGGGYFPQNQYAYCLIRDSYYGYYECEYMSVYDCDYDYGGETYSDDYTCGDYWWQSSNPQPPPSSSSRPVSSSSVEYTGGSCNVNDYGRVEIGGQVWMAKNWGC
ncbi:MAG: hypothetical protein LBC64_03310, partial [Fibromonadaceae bacterium]|nr:hypothetical protein [Fibromonadaceae bacterium]